ncbi:hypothetical protein [Streptomyces sp. NPDC048340]|uniref:hypothetical protein n=1 Tax=Streptomyces sp. NPDC048340 TaxID=3365537 RepID=UPI0037249C2C
MTTTDSGAELSYAEGRFFTMSDRAAVALAGNAQYTLKVTTEVTDSGNTPQAPPAPFTQTLRTRAPRFGIDPEWVFTCYPPPGDKGDFSRVLPHLTLNRPFLPWERKVGPLPKDSGLPWLALLLVTDDDLVHNGPSVLHRVTHPVAGYLDAHEPDTAVPELGDVSEELPGDAVNPAEALRTITVKASALREILPSRAELAYLAHIREVTQDDPSQYDGTARKYLTPGAYSVVMSSRLPRTPGTCYTAHLVSLEGWQRWDFLGGTRSLDGVSAASLVSLWSWWFETAPADRDDGPAGALMRLQSDVAPLRLPVPAQQAGTALERRVAGLARQGFVPLAHTLPSGESSFGWYRGPLTPVVPLASTPPPKDNSGNPKETSADALLIYHPDQAVFDATYASARTLGELLTASNGALTRALARFRAEAVAVAQRVVSETVAGGRRLPGATARQRLHVSFDRGLGLQITKALATGGSAAGRTAARGPADGLEGREGREESEGHEGQPPSLAQVLDCLAGPAGAPGSPADPETAALRQELKDKLDNAWTPVLNRHAPLVRAAGLRRDGLLAQVPFDHLVPDPRMLPDDSVRTCLVDPHWLDALTLGAVLYGAATPLEVDASLRMRRAVQEHMGKDTPEPRAGLLVRSGFLHRFPGSSVTVSATPLLTRRAAPDVVLWLFDSAKTGHAHAVLREPPHAFHFGVDSADAKGTLLLRQVTGRPGCAADGTALTGVFGYVRRPGGEVLRLAGADGLVAALAAKLRRPGLSPAEFALQLVATPHHLTIGIPLS